MPGRRQGWAQWDSHSCEDRRRTLAASGLSFPLRNATRAATLRSHKRSPVPHVLDARRRAATGRWRPGRGVHRLRGPGLVGLAVGSQDAIAWMLRKPSRGRPVTPPCGTSPPVPVDGCASALWHVPVERTARKHGVQSVVEAGADSVPLLAVRPVRARPTRLLTLPDDEPPEGVRGGVDAARAQHGRREAHGVLAPGPVAGRPEYGRAPTGRVRGPVECVGRLVMRVELTEGPVREPAEIPKCFVRARGAASRDAYRGTCGGLNQQHARVHLPGVGRGAALHVVGRGGRERLATSSYAQVGMFVCRAGVTTSVRCGPIQSIYWQFTSVGKAYSDFIKVGQCFRVGDSGGPLYDDDPIVAIGLATHGSNTSGSVASCAHNDYFGGPRIERITQRIPIRVQEF